MIKQSIKPLALVAFSIAGFMFAGCNSSTEPASLISTDTGETIVSNSFLQDSESCIAPPIRFQDTLQLTADQIASLKTIEDSLRAIEKEAIEAAKGDRTQIRAAMEAFRESIKASIESILTVEQLALLQSLKPKFEPRNAEGCRGRGNDSAAIADRLEHIAKRDSALLIRLATELALTNDQIAQIGALQTQIRTEHPADPRNVFYTGLQTILTAEQLEKLDALIDAFPPQGNNGHHGRHRGRGRK